jgi:hypothetical protein
MSAFADFLEGLFSRGEVLLREPPNVEAGESPHAREFLRAIFSNERLQVAGPPLDFDADVAVAAAGLLWRACWFLLEHGDPSATLERALALPPRHTASASFSADLSLRYLPQIHRRALSLSAEDVFPRLLAKILREWPLSGALSDVAEGPLSPLDFAGHPGLMLLYAERLADRPRPAWTPGGRTREYLELVYQGKGLELTPAEANKEEHAQP